MARLRRFHDKWRAEFWLVLAGLVVVVSFEITQSVVLHQAQFTPINGSTPTNEIYVYGPGVPLDDVYIHCQFARNLASGASYSFNKGETVTADTSPLWVTLLALGSLLTSKIAAAAVTLSIFFYLMIGPGIYRIMRDVFGTEERGAVLAGVLAVISSRLCWSAMSGMETSLAALLLLLVVEEHIRQRRTGLIRYREGLWLGLGLLTRPEFWFVALVLAIDWAIFYIKKKRAPMDAVFPVVLCLSIASPSFLLPLITRGGFASHSSIVQGVRGFTSMDFGYLWFALKIFLSSNVMLLLLIVGGLVISWKIPELRLMLIITFGLPILQAIVAPQYRHHGRYLFPVFPVFILAGSLSWAILKKRDFFNRHFWQIAVPALAIMFGIADTARWDVLEAQSVRNINDQHLAVSNWLSHNMLPGDGIAAQDVGAIGYYTGKPVIDLVGLVSPELYPLQHDQDLVWRKARSMGANLFVIYNRLNPAFYALHKDSLVLQTQFRVRAPLVSSADTVMSVYRIKGTLGAS